MSFEILTDSCSNLTEELIEKYNINIIPLSFFVDDEEFIGYIKGESQDSVKFYNMMREGKVVKTSLANPTKYSDLIEDIFKRGNDILYIGFSSALSGTYKNVENYLTDLLEEYSDRKVKCVDTLSACFGEGMLVVDAAKMKEQGKSLEETAEWLEENKLKQCHWFTVDDLKYLKRGGRVSATSAILGTVLQIKPVMHVDNEGRLVPVEKVKGRKASLLKLADNMERLYDNVSDVYISHGDCIQDAEFLKNEVEKRFNLKDIVINVIDPVIGAHSGPGTMAIFFKGTER